MRNKLARKELVNQSLVHCRSLFVLQLGRCVWCCSGIDTMLMPHGEKSWWRHQMETFSALLALCAGNSLVPVNYPHKGQWRGALMFSLICAWINRWVNNGEAGDFRRYRTHYDVIVKLWSDCEKMQARQDFFYTKRTFWSICWPNA